MMSGGRSGGDKSDGEEKEDALSQDDVPTATTLRPFGAAEPVTVPSLAEDIDRAPGAETTLTPSASTRWSSLVTALPESLRVSLELQGHADAPRVYELTMTRTVIGRGEQADIRLDDTKASRKHASILYSGSEFRVRDEGSGNGTLLNGSKVVEYALRDGDELLVGDSLLRFRIASR
jgi:hypothetical protein